MENHTACETIKSQNFKRHWTRMLNNRTCETTKWVIPWWWGSGWLRVPEEQERPHRDPLWQRCGVASTSLSSLHLEKRRVATEATRCQRFPVVMQCATESAVPMETRTARVAMETKASGIKTIKKYTPKCFFKERQTNSVSCLYNLKPNMVFHQRPLGDRNYF